MKNIRESAVGRDNGAMTIMVKFRNLKQGLFSKMVSEESVKLMESFTKVNFRMELPTDTAAKSIQVAPITKGYFKMVKDMAKANVFTKVV